MKIVGTESKNVNFIDMSWDRETEDKQNAAFQGVNKLPSAALRCYYKAWEHQDE